MNIKRIGIDLAKQVFQLHGVDGQEKVVLRKQLRRAQILGYFKQLPPCLIGMEACGGAHYWARELQKLGHINRRISFRMVSVIMTTWTEPKKEVKNAKKWLKP